MPQGDEWRRSRLGVVASRVYGELTATTEDQMHDAPHGPDSKTAPNQVLDTAATWPGVTTRSTPRGAIAVVVDEHEIGHVHLDRATLDLRLGARKA
jgi:hypothetical protein